MKKVICTTILLILICHSLFGSILFSVLKHGSKWLLPQTSKLLLRAVKPTIGPIVNTFKIPTTRIISYSAKGGERTLESLLHKIWDDIAKGIKALFRNSKHVVEVGKLSVMGYMGYKINQFFNFAETHPPAETAKKATIGLWNFMCNNTAFFIILLILIPQLRELLFYFVGQLYSVFVSILCLLLSFSSEKKKGKSE